MKSLFIKSGSILMIILHWSIVFSSKYSKHEQCNKSTYIINYYKKSKIESIYLFWGLLIYSSMVILARIISKLEQVQTCSHFRSESWSPTHFDRRSSLGAIAIGTAIHTAFLSFWLLLPLIAFVVVFLSTRTPSRYLHPVVRFRNVTNCMNLFEWWHISLKIEKATVSLACIFCF